jgi:glycosyltransferase involved in cell wall biosynthesis
VVIPRHDLEYETASGTLLEAMAMGRAVITSRTRGGMDILRDGEQGIYVPPGDARALREAIEFLLANPEKARQMGEAGRALVEANYTLDTFVERVAAIVEAVTPR